MSVTTLLSMPLGADLFSQAIAQSGAAAHTLTKDEGRMVSGYLADVLGVPPDRDSMKAIPLDNFRFGACHAVEIPFVFDTAIRTEIRP